MNKIFLIGNLTRDPELTETSSGISKCRFTIAVNRPASDKEVDYFDCTAWRGQADNVARYCSKGKKVLVEGQAQIRTYTDKQGNDKKAFEIVAQSVEFLSPRQEDGQQQVKPQTAKKQPLQSFDDDGDIPF
ncbi:MAG: single-stranded DNA-binding protein [Clostridia bacterium]|nr:single-stranded DNA-binding protein [Clostridia bacterium]